MVAPHCRFEGPREGGLHFWNFVYTHDVTACDATTGSTAQYLLILHVKTGREEREKERVLTTMEPQKTRRV